MYKKEKIFHFFIELSFDQFLDIEIWLAILQSQTSFSHTSAYLNPFITITIFHLYALIEIISKNITSQLFTFH